MTVVQVSAVVLAVLAAIGVRQGEKARKVGPAGENNAVGSDRSGGVVVVAIVAVVVGMALQSYHTVAPQVTHLARPRGGFRCCPRRPRPLDRGPDLLARLTSPGARRSLSRGLLSHGLHCLFSSLSRSGVCVAAFFFFPFRLRCAVARHSAEKICARACALF